MRLPATAGSRTLTNSLVGATLTLGDLALNNDTGTARTFYLTILLTHTVLAAAVPFLAGITVVRAWRQRYAQHRKIARWTLPIWLYVSVTGVVIYLMLYQL